MIVRAIDASGDWTYGAGKSNYLSANAAIAQDINTRLGSFLGNCFFDLGAGIDWFNLLGAKNQAALNLAISSIILNTNLVTSQLQLNVTLDAKRNLSISYVVQTVYSSMSSTFAFTPSIG